VSLLFALLGTAAALLALVWAFSQMKTRNAAQALRISLGVAGLVLGALLTMRGLAIIGAPLAAAALGLLGVALRGPQAPPGAGRQNGQQQGRGPRPQRGAMTRKEAAAVLGIDENAGEAEVRRAYREMMKRVHPDAGGSDALAARVQEARDVLLGGG